MSLLTKPPLLLRRALLVDVVGSGAVALLLVAGAGPLPDLLGLPALLLRSAGAFLVAYVAYVAFVATRERIPAGLAWSIVALNAAWAFASLGLLQTSLVVPTVLGTAFVVAQAVAVAAFGVTQYVGLRAR
jgi:hypothetical protein